MEKLKFWHLIFFFKKELGWSFRPDREYKSKNHFGNNSICCLKISTKQYRNWTKNGVRCNWIAKIWFCAKSVRRMLWMCLEISWNLNELFISKSSLFDWNETNLIRFPLKLIENRLCVQRSKFNLARPEFNWREIIRNFLFLCKHSNRYPMFISYQSVCMENAVPDIVSDWPSNSLDRYPKQLDHIGRWWWWCKTKFNLTTDGLLSPTKIAFNMPLDGIILIKHDFLFRNELISVFYPQSSIGSVCKHIIWKYAFAMWIGHAKSNRQNGVWRRCSRKTFVIKKISVIVLE